MSQEGSTNPYTLSRFILQEHNDRELTILMSSIQLACKYIATSVRKAGPMLLHDQSNQGSRMCEEQKAAGRQTSNIYASERSDN